MFSLALLVSDPKATSRCLQSPGRAALSVRHTAEIPVCQFKWRSPSSSACAFTSIAKYSGKQGHRDIPSGKSLSQKPTKRQHLQKTATQGGSSLLLSSLNILPFLFAANWSPSNYSQAVWDAREQHHWRKKIFHSSPSPPCGRCASLLQLWWALHVPLGQALHSSRV